jgi:glyoxalase family protein
LWADRLGGVGIAVQRGPGHLRFEDPEGLGLELVVEDVPDAPLVAARGGVPAEHALLGFAGVRAYASAPDRSAPLLEQVLGFAPAGGGRWDARGSARGGWIAYDGPPLDRGRPGAGTVHHVAWAVPMGDIEAWQERVAAAGARATPVVERFYFRSVYFREPSGVLFELATMGPGFAVDEDPEHLGERLSLPPFLEDRRERIEAVLTPLGLDDVRGEGSRVP